MVIKWSNFAKSNLHDFIQNSKLYSPNIYVKNLVNSVSILKDNPKAGKILFIYNEMEFRQLIYKMHRVIYRISDNEIHIGAVLHTARNLETSLRFIKKFLK